MILNESLMNLLATIKPIYIVNCDDIDLNDYINNTNCGGECFGSCEGGCSGCCMGDCYGGCDGTADMGPGSY